MNELVLVADRNCFGTDLPNGIHPYDMRGLNHKNYGFIARPFVDSKTGTGIVVGTYLPQVLSYIVVMYGEFYLSYARNGSEEGLLGKRSIGVGGHCSLEDYAKHGSLAQCLVRGTLRELEEELGVWCTDLRAGMGFNTDIINKIIVSNSDRVSAVHVGLTGEFVLSESTYVDLELSSELHHACWLTKQELKDSIAEYETWSQMLIEAL